MKDSGLALYSGLNVNPKQNSPVRLLQWANGKLHENAMTQISGTIIDQTWAGQFSNQEPVDYSSATAGRD